MHDPGTFRSPGPSLDPYHDRIQSTEIRATPLLSPTTMSLALAPIVELYRWGLQPVAPFSWFGIQIGAIDVAAAVRLCLVLRQVRELVAKTYKDHAAHATAGASEKEKAAAAALGPKFEEKSLVRDLAATLIVVHGGDAIGEQRRSCFACTCKTDVVLIQHLSLVSRRLSCLQACILSRTG